MRASVFCMSTKKEKILIVGGVGYVGGYMTDLLFNAGYDVTVYDNLTYEPRFLKQVPFINGDIRDTKKLSAIIDDFDIVIWLAALVGDAACAIDPKMTEAVNVGPIRWLAKNYKGQIIYMSSCSVYGINGNLLSESSPLKPLSHYAATKVDAENIISQRADNYLIFRLGTLFGLSDEHSRIRLDLVVNIFTKQATLGEQLVVYDGEQWRPLLHVRDVGEAVLFAIENEINGFYNLSAKNYRIKDIADKIKEIIPGTNVAYANTKFEDKRDYKVSNEKFCSRGWKPKYTLEHGICEMHELIKGGRIKQPNDALYLNAVYLRGRPQ